MTRIKCFLGGEPVLTLPRGRAPQGRAMRSRRPRFTSSTTAMSSMPYVASHMHCSIWSIRDQLRAHVFLCMLAYYLEWHMRQKLAPILFDDTDKQAAEAVRASVVAPAQRSQAAISKQTTGYTPDGLPAHSFRALLAESSTQVIQNEGITSSASRGRRRW